MVASPSTQRADATGPARGWIIRGVVLLGLLSLTGWTATRSDALTEAQAASRRGDPARALALALDHLDRRPWSREAAKLAALSLSRLDFASEAEAYYRKAGTLDLAELHVRALGIVRSNERERAIEAYREILHRWPDEPLALRRLASVYLSQDRLVEGLALAERLAEDPNHRVVGLTMVGAFNHRLGEVDRAVPSFEEVTRLDPDLEIMPLPRWQFWMYYTEDLLKVGRVEDAKRLLLRALAVEGNHTVLLDLLGQAYMAQGELDEAELAWRRELNLDPGSYPALLHLGRLALVRDRPDEAVGLLRRAAELRPEAYSPLYSLLQAHQRLGDEEETLRLRQKLDDHRARYGTPARGMGAPPIPEPHDHDQPRTQPMS